VDDSELRSGRLDYYNRKNHYGKGLRKMAFAET
jgi:hypothetical protein